MFLFRVRWRIVSPRQQDPTGAHNSTTIVALEGCKTNPEFEDSFAGWGRTKRTQTTDRAVRVVKKHPPPPPSIFREAAEQPLIRRGLRYACLASMLPICNGTSKEKWSVVLPDRVINQQCACASHVCHTWDSHPPPGCHCTRQENTIKKTPCCP